MQTPPSHESSTLSRLRSPSVSAETSHSTGSLTRTLTRLRTLSLSRRGDRNIGSTDSAPETVDSQTNELKLGGGGTRPASPKTSTPPKSRLRTFSVSRERPLSAFKGTLQIPDAETESESSISSEFLGTSRTREKSPQATSTAERAERTRSWSISARPQSPLRPRHKLFTTTKFSDRIEDYEVISNLGVVDDISWLYECKYLPTYQTICLKVTDLSVTEDQNFLREMQNSIANTALIRHPNILPYLRSFVEGERLWTIVPPIREGSLKSIVQDRFPEGLPEEAVATILRDVVSALAYMHSCSYIHNDVRIHNIVLDSNGDVRLTGLHQMTQLETDGVPRNSTYGYMGDPEWMAPEVIVQDSTHTVKADVYSLGITALELLYGRTPYDAWQPLKIVLYKTKFDGVPPIMIEKRVTKSFLKLVESCLRRNPDQRPNMQELLEHLFFKQVRSKSYLANLLRKTVTPSDSRNDLQSLGQPRSSIYEFPSAHESRNSLAYGDVVNHTEGNPSAIFV